jgi:hypothetical protein
VNIRAPAIYIPEAAACLQFMIEQLGPDYVEAIWHIRNREQKARDELFENFRLRGAVTRPKPEKKRPYLRLVRSIAASFM